ncbi:MAG: hypothetical protein ACPGLV_17550, partial [Bacteroidia bacterium]
MAKEFIKKLLLWFKSLSKAKQIIVAGSAGSLAFVLLFYFLILIGLFGAIPNKRDLTNLEALQASVIYDQTGEKLGKIFEVNRTYVKYDTLPT